MGKIHPQRGFSFLGILIAVAIVGILMVMSIQNYQPVMSSMRPGGGSRPGLGLTTAKAHLTQLHQAEFMYYNVHKSYATWAELVQDGEIQHGYSDKAKGKGTPFIPNYNIDIQITEEGFTITASPDLAAGAEPGSPTLKIDQEGIVEEVASK
jgi:Tfp pilus assembly protein PilE